jgi:hypothetical protein
MSTSRLSGFWTALAGAALAASLTSCGSASGTVSPSPSVDLGSPSASETTAASPTVEPTLTTPATTATAPAPAASAPPAAGQLYTFPDGRLSFSYPAGWSVKTVEQPYVQGHASGAKPVDAVISDGTGNEVALIQSNVYAGGVSTDVQRTILDQVPLPQVTARDGSGLVFGFIHDTSQGVSSFHAGVRRAQEFQPGFSTSGSDYFELNNGMTVAKVVFGNPAFDSAESAKAWMATDQYSELKKIFLSLKSS